MPPPRTAAIELCWEHPDIAPAIAAARTAAPHTRERVLATVMFTDVVGSTELVAQLGDARWRELLERHDEILRVAARRHGGRVVKSLGDGALALFDAPSGALSAALAIREQLGRIGLSARAGLHAGECELLPGRDVGGIAVHIASRIAALAGPGDVLASATVRDLTIGAPFRLRWRGSHRLKGVAEPWRLFAVHA